MNHSAEGSFVHFKGERFYKIQQIDAIPPFFMSLISDSDHWLFISSTGGLTAGRVSPENALFPYVPVDKVHESTHHTGSLSLLHITIEQTTVLWEPFNDGISTDQKERNLYKNTLGNKVCFEEINHTLGLSIQISWMFSEAYGLVRQTHLSNHSGKTVQVRCLDGIRNILPAMTPKTLQSDASSLIDAYKWNEIDTETGVAIYTLYSGITDRPQPLEVLYANTVFQVGLDQPKVLLTDRQVKAFKQGHTLTAEPITRGLRGAYLTECTFELADQTSHEWYLVAELKQSQSDVATLIKARQNPSTLQTDLIESILSGSNDLTSIMARCDGLQTTAEETVSVHHFANVVFNSLRGGVFSDQYWISRCDLIKTIQIFNRPVYQNHQAFLSRLPSKFTLSELLAKVEATQDFQLERLCREYLPITFGRRHGDPSRPWNHFSIHLKDEMGAPRLSYQGNWRDIFQNWEALSLSYPNFIESIIAKFVNASTIDGFNPYRIEKTGIDWEVENPEDPWSYIGYWGDHQIIYLLKLLEHSENFHPSQLHQLLRRPVFCYANVPYKIKPFADLAKDAKNTVEFDFALNHTIEQQVDELGSDGKMWLDAKGQVYQVNLLEKLIIPLLSKLSNLVLNGGIWLNTQRPEWNDANNALVGQGISMVTLYYLRRYVAFLTNLIAQEHHPFELSLEVSQWLHAQLNTLQQAANQLDLDQISDQERLSLLVALGESASHYRQTVYQQGFSNKVAEPIETLRSLLAVSTDLLDKTIQHSAREDGLYQAYNLLQFAPQSLTVQTLYPMLEGQVAALSSGTLKPEQVIHTLNQLFVSPLYRTDQHSFILYPNKSGIGFLQKNQIAPNALTNLPLLNLMLEQPDTRLILQDAQQIIRFNPALVNKQAVSEIIDQMIPDYGEALKRNRTAILDLYETVFNHQEFTGRSGGMFAYEGLGSIYWHMVSKLLLAVQENFFKAKDQQASQTTLHTLGELYYQVRKGIGFNKSPSEYGAFPTDPYSHTPEHSGASQPGMTGQVKEEILTRFGELGIRVRKGCVYFEPALLRSQEFIASPSQFDYLDIDDQWQSMPLAEQSLAFTWCQIPFIYQLTEQSKPRLTLHWQNGSIEELEAHYLNESLSQAIFNRTGDIQAVTLTLPSDQLFN